MYLYEIVGEALDTSTNNTVVVYRALYGDRKLFTRPKDEFYSEVDVWKYPDVHQYYRFEAFNKN